MRPLTTCVLAISIFLPSICISCKEKGEVRHYRTDKAPVATTPQTPATPSTQKASPYSWTLPEGWSAQPASGMRLATIIIPTAGSELNASLTEFGGDLAGNVNRWRGQIGLPQLPESEVLPALEKVDTGLGQGYIATLSNPASPEKAMLAAIIPRPSGTSVFVKVTGTTEELQSIAPSFRQFTQSLK